MILHGVFPNTERLVIAWLRAWFARTGNAIDVWSEFPEGWEDDDVETPLPAVLVERIPGARSRDNSAEFEGSSTLDVTVWASTRPDLWPIVQQIEVAMIALRNSTTPAIDEVTIPQGFGVVEYSNPHVRRAVASFELTARAA